jgi:pimeloyl-ACP methyl ester carboxylesterase
VTDQHEGGLRGLAAHPGFKRGAAVGGALGGALATAVVARRLGGAHRQHHRDGSPATLLPGDLTPDRSERVIADDGVALHVDEVGDLDAPLTAVFVHGWSLTRECWYLQRPDLAGPGVRMVFPDLRGHGRSGRPEPASCTIEQLAADLVSILDARVPRGRVVLVGHSLGGMTLMGLADARPDLFGPAGRVAGVGLLSTSAGRLSEVTLGLPAVLGPALRLVRPRLTGPLVRHGDRLQSGRALAGPALTRALVRRLSFAGPAPTGATELMASMVDQCPLPVLAAFESQFLRHDKLAALSVLADTPAMVLVGERDLLTPVSHSRAIAAALPAAVLTVLPHTGHMVQLERPSEVTRELCALFERAAAR